MWIKFSTNIKLSRLNAYDVSTVLADYLEGTPAWYGQRSNKSPRHDLVREQHLFVLLSTKPHLAPPLA